MTQEQTRKLTGVDIVEIITETITESAKDFMSMEDRRPMVHMVASLAFDLFKTVRDGIDFESDNPTSGRGRNMKRGRLLVQCLRKLDKSEPEPETEEIEEIDAEEVE